MKTACLQFNPIQENTYVVWDDTKQCVVIDAGNSSPREDAALDNFIAGHGLEPVMAINTHGHFDHTLGVGHLKERYGIPFALSGKDRFLLDNASASGSVFGVKVGAMPPAEIDLDGTPEIRFGRTTLRVIPTPGHTPGHVAFYEPQAKALFTGDTLFTSRSAARTCRAATTRGSCVRSSTRCFRWAKRCTSIPVTVRRRPSATKRSTTPSSSRC